MRVGTWIWIIAGLAAGGCALDAADDATEDTSTAASAVTVGRANNVDVGTLLLRSTDAPDGASIGTMGFCSLFYVEQIDPATEMAYGFSYMLGKHGWARATAGTRVYLTVNPCLAAGGSALAPDAPAR